MARSATENYETTSAKIHSVVKIAAEGQATGRLPVANRPSVQPPAPLLLVAAATRKSYKAR